MSTSGRMSGAAAAVLLLAWPTGPASAVIRVDLPLSEVFQSAKEVLIARVASVDAAGRQAKLCETVTLEELGKKVLLPRDRALALDLGGDAALAGRLRAGEPVVFFVGKSVSAAHAGDAWFIAAQAGPAAWKIAGRHDIARTFPGTTPSLIRALLKLRAGKAPMVDAVMHHTWHGDHKLQVLDAKGKVSAMAATDADGDGKADLVLADERGVRFHRGGGARQPFADATEAWGLAGAAARRIAFTDANGDRRPDLLLDELYLNARSRFVRSKAGINLAGQEVLAVALMDADGDGRPDAVVLTRDGGGTVYSNPGRDAAWPASRLKRLWEGGEPPLAAHIGDWGDDGKPHVMVIRADGLTRYSLAGEAADLQRLTGENPMFRGKPRYFPMPDYVASAAWDRSGGDGNLDLLVATGRGKPYDLELVGRGHGAFFSNTEGGVSIVEERGGRQRSRQTRVAAMTPADMHGDGSFEMLVLEADGTLWQKDSPIYVRGKAIEESGER